MAKIWLDASGKILTNADGNPYYTDECCCASSSACSQYYGCWQYYETVAVDDTGAPVWGEDGSYDFGAQHWSAPTMRSNACMPMGQSPAQQPNRWVLDTGNELGTAHIWALMSSTCDSACSDCDVPQPGKIRMPPNSMLGNCTELGGSISGEIPNYEYTVSHIHVSIYSETEGGERVLMDEYDWPVHNAASLPAPGVGEIVVYSYGQFRATRRYLDNIIEPPIPEGCCDDDIAGSGICSNIASTQHAVAHGSYTYMEVTNASTYDAEGHVHTVDAANGAYYKLPYADAWTQNKGWSPFYMLGSDVYYVHLSDTGVAVTDRIYADVSSVSVEYERIRYMPGALDIRKDLWAEIYPEQKTYPEHVGIGAIWEARGAYARKQSVPHDYIRDFGEKPMVQASPDWHYQPYVVTGFDLGELNSSNWQYAMLESDTQVDGIYFAELSGVACYTYRHMYVFASWGGCAEDTPTGSFCGPTGFNRTVKTGVFKYASDVRSVNMWRGDRTIWVHELDTPIGAVGGVRAVDVKYDQHASMVVKLDIDNYPDWFVSELCSSYIDGTAPNVPTPVFDDSAWYCENCPRTPCDEWPAGSRWSMPMSKDCSYVGSWSGKSPISHIGYGVAEDCDCVNGIVGVTKQHQRRGNDYYAVASPLYEMSVCPNWSAYAYAYMVLSSETKCAVYDTDDNGNVTTTWHRTGGDEYVALSKVIPLDVTWEGNVAGSCKATASTYLTNGVYPQDVLDGCNSLHVEFKSAGFVLEQRTGMCCDNGHLDANSGYASGRMLRLAAIAGHSGCVDGWQRAEVVLPAGTEITFTGTCYNLVDNETGKRGVNYGEIWDPTGGASHTYNQVSHIKAYTSRTYSASTVLADSAVIRGNGGLSIMFSSVQVSGAGACEFTYESTYNWLSYDLGYDYNVARLKADEYIAVSSATSSSFASTMSARVAVSRRLDGNTGEYSLGVDRTASNPVAGCSDPAECMYIERFMASGRRTSDRWTRESSGGPWVHDPAYPTTSNISGYAEYIQVRIPTDVASTTFEIPNEAAASTFCCTTFPIESDQVEQGLREGMFYDDSDGNGSAANMRGANGWFDVREYREWAYWPEGNPYTPMPESTGTGYMPSFEGDRRYVWDVQYMKTTSKRIQSASVVITIPEQ